MFNSVNNIVLTKHELARNGFAAKSTLSNQNYLLTFYQYTELKELNKKGTTELQS